MVMIMSCSLSDADRAKESLKSEAEAAHKMLQGANVDPATKCISVDFDGENFTYTYEINEEDASIEQMRTEKETLEQFLKDNLSNSAEFSAVKRNLQMINGKVKYVYIGSKSKDKLELFINF